jgi:hypothetical protein
MHTKFAWNPIGYKSFGRNVYRFEDNQIYLTYAVFYAHVTKNEKYSHLQNNKNARKLSYAHFFASSLYICIAPQMNVHTTCYAMWNNALLKWIQNLFTNKSTYSCIRTR